jgi:hypothetical protein
MNMMAIRFFGLPADAVGYRALEAWKRLSTGPILEQHAWLESQETVTEVVLYVLPSRQPEFIAYQVEVLVGAVPTLIGRKPTRWRSRAIVVPSLTP